MSKGTASWRCPLWKICFVLSAWLLWWSIMPSALAVPVIGYFKAICWIKIFSVPQQVGAWLNLVTMQPFSHRGWDLPNNLSGLSVPPFSPYYKVLLSDYKKACHGWGISGASDFSHSFLSWKWNKTSRIKWENVHWENFKISLFKEYVQCIN